MKFMKFFKILEINFNKNLSSTQSYLLKAFATLPKHINYLHPNTEYMMILFFRIKFYIFVISFCILINGVK